MKKLLLAVSLAVGANVAQADIVSGGLTLTSGSGSFDSTPLTQSFQSGVGLDISAGDDGWGGNWSALPTALYTSGSYGMLTANVNTAVQFTYLGKVAAYNNITAFANGQTLDDSTEGSSFFISEVKAGDRIEFGFKTLTSGAEGSIINGQANEDYLGMMYFDASAWNNMYGTSYDFLIGYNDSASWDKDYDDYVVGVSAVPVPAALPLMASALGMFGIARRRKAVA